MKKITFLLLITFSLLSIDAKSQAWANVGAGIPNGSIYSIKEYNSELIVGGVFNNSGGIQVSNISKWNGTVWSTLGSGVNGSVQCFAIFNSDLYVGGDFTIAGGNSSYGIAKWNGMSWVSIPSILGTSSTYIYALEVYNNELYASVGLYGSGGTTVSLYKFNGSSWSAVAAVGNGSYAPSVSSLKVYNGDLYVGGEFSTVNGSSFNNIAKWNGSTWSSVGTGIPLSTTSHNRNIWDMEIFNGELCVAGEFNYADGLAVNNIAKWDGTNWTTMGTGCNYTIIDLEVFNTDLCVGGYYNIEKWDGTNWSTLGNQLFVTAHALCAYNNVVFAGGYNWDQVVNSSTIYNIGQLSNLTSINEEKKSNLLIYPNPTTDILTITNAKGSYFVTDIYGRMITVININTDNYQLNTKSFSSGIYFIISKEDNSSIKFIKQ
ncbi:MAG: T9SS type A sorting domain-containing protein [Flavobacteriales bacterium]|nr:T9SS type A sorting domain-containing protein [Flavobacteriales bacterium]